MTSSHPTPHEIDEPQPPQAKPIARWWRKLADWFHAGVCVAFVGSLIGFAGSIDFRFDLFSHFRLTYATALGAGLILALLLRQRKLAIAWAVGLSINLAVIVPLFLSPGTQGGENISASDLRVQMINVLRDNERKPAAIDAIRKADADIVVAVEVDDAWLAALKQGLADRWPHSIAEPRGDAFGIAMFSKQPLDSAAIFESPGSYGTSIRSVLSTGGTSLTIYGTHPFPPVTPFNQQNWLTHMDDLARRVAAEQGPVIVIGDYNTTPWSANYRRFRDASGLIDSLQGFGPQASWPVFVPYAGLPIDHVMVSPGIVTRNRRVGPFVGSDHFPVTVDLAIPAQVSKPGCR
jgi:endonuclease/exonuclease/phosphatase (EEP) superfamily protein YafD